MLSKSQQKDNQVNRIGNLGIAFLREDHIHRAVLRQHIVDGRHSSNQSDLGQEAGDAQGQCSAADIAGQPVVLLSRLDDLHIEEVPDRENRGCDLADDRGHSRTHHPPPEGENENGIQDDVDEGAGQGGGHGEFRVSIGLPIRAVPRC